MLVRHAEAVKNIESVHGGVGSTLTPAGVEAAHVLATTLSGMMGPCHVHYVDRPQCQETAQIIHARVDGRGLSVLNVRPYHLGVLAGLSEAEAHRRFPELARRMDRYRAGEIEIAEVAIPGATDAWDFYTECRRALVALQNACSACDIVVVGTRSILVGLVNVACSRLPTPGGGYREIPWKNCGVCILSGALDVEALYGVVA